VQEHIHKAQAARAAKTVLKWVFGSDAEPKKGLDTGFRSLFRDATNSDFKISGLSYMLEPNVSSAGSPIEFKLRMTGEKVLANSKPQNVRVSVEGSGAVPLRASIESIDDETTTIQFVGGIFFA
jgi:hypothetical protein